MQSCATSPDHVYLPASGGDLSEAFAAIGRDITAIKARPLRWGSVGRNLPKPAVL